MATSIIDIKNLILTKVQSLTHIAEVADYGTGNFNEYPAATVTIEGGDSAERQNVRRMHTLKFLHFH